MYLILMRQMKQNETRLEFSVIKDSFVAEKHSFKSTRDFSWLGNYIQDTGNQQKPFQM